MPVHPLPGNHDDVGALLAAFPEVPAANYAVTVAGVRLLCCDSTVPGQDGGDLSDPGWLDATLAEEPRHAVGRGDAPPAVRPGDRAGSTGWDTRGPTGSPP